MKKFIVVVLLALNVGKCSAVGFFDKMNQFIIYGPVILEQFIAQPIDTIREIKREIQTALAHQLPQPQTNVVPEQTQQMLLPEAHLDQNNNQQPDEEINPQNNAAEINAPTISAQQEQPLATQIEENIQTNAFPTQEANNAQI